MQRAVSGRAGCFGRAAGAPDAAQPGSRLSFAVACWSQSVHRSRSVARHGSVSEDRFAMQKDLQDQRFRLHQCTQL